MNVLRIYLDCIDAGQLNLTTWILNYISYSLIRFNQENIMYKTILVPIDMAHVEKGKAMIDIAMAQGSKDT
jgi:hypothetical protein